MKRLPAVAGNEPFERWNTHFSLTVEQTVFDVPLHLSQDPSSHNLGTTVWDASIVLAKYLERNARKGELSRQKVRGRRAVELGAGMGLAGMAFALLGANVLLTDTGGAVLSLLRHNVAENLTPAALKLRSTDWAPRTAGSVSVAELDWGQTEQYAAVCPPFDFVLAADCVYSEAAVPHFLAAVLAMCNARTRVVITNEFRSSTVHDLFIASFSRHFSVRRVPVARMDPHYQHPLIHIYLMKKRKDKTGEAHDDGAEVETRASAKVDEGEAAAVPEDADAASAAVLQECAECGAQEGVSERQEGGGAAEGGELSPESDKAQRQAFETRRCGVQLARLLGGVH